jgi:periplasmic protein TonB
MSNIFGSLEPVVSPPQATVPEPLGTFTRAIIVEALRHPGWCPLDCVVSVLVHGAILFALLILPLFFPPELHPRIHEEAVFVTPVPPPAVRSAEDGHFAHSLSQRRVVVGHELFAPILAPRSAFATLAAAAAPPPVISSGVPGGISNLLGDGLERLPMLVGPATPADVRMIQMGGQVEAARLMYSVSLGYPELAKAMRIFGKVILEATIDERGRVENVRRLSGPWLLATGAVEAVSRLKFEPALLNGEPTHCRLIVVVNFRLFDDPPVY